MHWNRPPEGSDSSLRSGILTALKHSRGRRYRFLQFVIFLCWYIVHIATAIVRTPKEVACRCLPYETLWDIIVGV